MGTRGGAGTVVGSSLSPREVVGEVATAVGETAADANSWWTSMSKKLFPSGCLSHRSCCISMAETCLVEEVEEGHVELPVAKAKAG